MGFTDKIRSVLSTKTMVKWHMKGDIEHKRLYLASSSEALRSLVKPNLGRLRRLTRYEK